LGSLDFLSKPGYIHNGSIMPDEIKVLDYYYVQVPNKAGAAASLLTSFKEAGINLLAFSGFPEGRRAQLDFVPQDPAAFRAAAKKLGVAISPKKAVFLIQGSERCGIAADLLGALAGAGINATSMQVLCAGEDRYGALLWVAQEEVRKAKKVLEKFLAR
jgi:hypothetical protein